MNFLLSLKPACQDDFVIFVSSRIMRQSILDFIIYSSPLQLQPDAPWAFKPILRVFKKEPSCISAGASCNRLYECESVHHELTNNQTTQFPK